MIVGVALFIFALAYLFSLAAGGASYINTKQQNKANLEQNQELWAQRERDIARKYDTYYDPNVKQCTHWFYADGSLKKDPHTGQFYPKGQYWATSNGLDCHLNPAGADVPRAPRN